MADLDCTEFELIEHHGEAGLEGPDKSFEVVHLTVEDEIEHLDEGSECKQENRKESRKVLDNIYYSDCILLLQ